MKNHPIELNKKCSNEYLIYTRKSTDDADNQKNSIAYQINESMQFSVKAQLKISNVNIMGFCTDGIIEEHHSGYKQDDGFISNVDGTITYKVLRPKFLTLVNLLQQREFKGVICLCWDRFSRNESDDVLIKKLMNQGIDVRFIQANYDNSSSGALHMDIDGMFSRHYSRVISEKVKASYSKLISEGKCIYTAPIGYLNKGSDNKPFDLQRAPIIKRMFELYATGEWSFTSLSRWANNQGLLTKATRKKRTKEEKAVGLDPETMKKVPRQITPKAVENILANPFYTGKLHYHGNIIDSKVHLPLIDTALFYKVQFMLNKKTTSIHYPDKIFFTYRGLLKCGHCLRVYSAYEQKGINYYRSKCKDDCPNSFKHVKESWITVQVQTIIDKISFTDEELAEIEKVADVSLKRITAKRNTEIEDLYRQHKRLLSDFDFLIKDKLNLIRTEVYTPKQLKDEEIRLTLDIQEIEARIEANSVSTQIMYDYVINYSKLIKKMAKYFTNAMDNEKREIVTNTFTELFIEDGNLKYSAKEGFEALLKRFSIPNQYSGSPDYVFSELLNLYFALKSISKI